MANITKFFGYIKDERTVQRVKVLTGGSDDLNRKQTGR
jgi:hypothetical protein